MLQNTKKNALIAKNILFKFLVSFYQFSSSLIFSTIIMTIFFKSDFECVENLLWKFYLRPVRKLNIVNELLKIFKICM